MLEDYFFKKPTRWIFGGVVAVVCGLLIFAAGIAVGERDERPRPESPFSAYGVPLPHMFQDPGHGAVGEVESVSLPNSFVMETRDNINESIILASSTKLEPAGLSTSSLLVPEAHVIVIGTPEGTSSINALLIRVLPPQ